MHLGSELYPDDKEYKAFLAAHGGSSNASTGVNRTGQRQEEDKALGTHTVCM